MVGESPVRRAQLIHTFGVGALHVTNEGVGLICGGLDHWFPADATSEYDKSEFKIREERLERRLGVRYFMKPPDFRRIRRRDFGPRVNREIKIPFLRFPRWHYCDSRFKKCGIMKRIGLAEQGDVSKCKECGGRMTQVPLITVCENGHIDDFPWKEFVHDELNPTCEGGEGYLEFISSGTPSLAGTTIRCKACKMTRRIPAGALQHGITVAERKFICSGCRPWLGNAPPEQCEHRATVSLKSASPVYSARTSSSIFLPDGINSDLKDIFRAPEIYITIDNIEKLRNYKIKGKELLDPSTIEDVIIKGMVEKQEIDKKLKPFSEGEIDACIKSEILGDEERDSQGAEDFGTQGEEEMYRHREYDLLLRENSNRDFQTTPQDIGKYTRIINDHFDMVTSVNNLVVTTTLYGFWRVRLNAPPPLIESKRKLRLKNKPQEWLPAVQESGEGFFMRIREDKLKEWEERKDIKNRIGTMQRNLDQATRIPGQNLHPRKILLHTISHLLINQLVFDSGYSASSIKERIYSSTDPGRSMSGLLIYTGGGDSDGSMGGLVRMANPGYLEETLRKAIEKSNWCSVDPVCNEMGASGQGPYKLNLAACHNCALVPETSCEEYNNYLDRFMVTGNEKNRKAGFFDRWYSAFRRDAAESSNGKDT